jgi:hypothetical protein
MTYTNSLLLINVDPGFSRQEWIRSRPSKTFRTSYTLSSFPSRSLLCKSWHNLLKTNNASRECGSSRSWPVPAVVLGAVTSSWTAEASSSSLICLYLHSKEHTGCRVCLQYKFAEALQDTHQPNLPLGIPSSFTSSKLAASLSATRLLAGVAVFSAAPSWPSLLRAFDDLGTEKRATVLSSSFIWPIKRLSCSPCCPAS